MNPCVKGDDFSPFFLLSVILRDESVFGVRILDTTQIRRPIAFPFAGDVTV